MSKNTVLPIPPQAEEALARLREAGYEAYLVGGCVRDFLRGVTPHDFDITTSAYPDEVHSVFVGERLIDTGIKHGTVTLLIDGMPLEITTYREDGDYLDARHPTAVNFTSSLREDVARRDFTMNAIAYNPQDGFRDYFGGCADIQEKIIRAVGEPKRRFEEDALRILRALRFSAVLDFTIEEETAKAALETAPLLTRISAERVQVELVKLLCGVSAGRVISVYGAALAPIFPHWYRAAFLAYEGTRVSRMTELLPILPPEPVLRLVAFLHPMFADAGADAVSEMLDALRFDKRTHRRAVKILSHLDDPCTGEKKVLRRFLSGVGEEDAALLLAYHKAEATLGKDTARLSALEEAEETLADLCRTGAVCSVTDLAVRGGDLIALGIPPGRPLGTALATLLEAVLDGEVENEKEALIAYAKRNFSSKG